MGAKQPAKRRRKARPSGPTLTRAITHIRLQEANRGKLAALDAVWAVYQPLCERYLEHFCTTAEPDKDADFVFESELSARWQRVAVQQAAGIAKSWRSNRANHRADYEARLARYEALGETEQRGRKRPEWTEPSIPALHTVCIQANANVVQQTATDADVLTLTTAEQGLFDLWLRVSTLERGKPVYVPVKLARYHKRALGSAKPGSSVTLHRRDDEWWLTLAVTEAKPELTPTDGQCGVDIGIRHTLTDDAGNHYGSFSADLLALQTRVRAKTSRKAKLRACLEKKGVDKLPSTSSAIAQKLSRRTQQEINFAVNRFLDAHPRDRIALEALDIASMRFKSRRMNGVLRASQLAHISEQIVWSAAKRGLPIVFVNAAYSSQECPRCHYTARANRPDQQTFCCQVCGERANADVLAAGNLKRRLDDTELAACHTLPQVKALLDQRHAVWQERHKGYP